MKKYSVLLFLVALLIPFTVFASKAETDYIWITDTANLKVGNLNITNLNFVDYREESSKSFGVTGDIVNSGDDLEYVSRIEYYDGNKSLLCSETINLVAKKGKGKFNHLSNIDLMSSYAGFYVNYYKLIIDDSPLAIIESKTPSKMNEYSYLDYTIDKYDINMVVNENNTFDITETITAHYNVEKHGILRNLPLRNEIVRLDGTTSRNRAKVSNISVDSKYTAYKENGNYVIKIGDANETMTGDATYVIKYNYNIGEDPSKDYDELYFNLIGTGWDTVIGNVTFNIVMPKEFDSSKLGFSKGFKGSTNNDGIKYSVSDNVISGRYDGVLGKGEALTVRCELDEGYFVGAGFETSILDYMPFLLPIVLLIASAITWIKKCKNDLVVDTVEFYPPEGCNSLDTGFLYKGKAVNKDVTSLLVYLANKGYIKISDTNNVDISKLNLGEDKITAANEKIVELQSKIDDLKINNPNSKKIKYYENMLEVYKNIDKPIDYQKYGVSNSISKKDKFIISKIKEYDGKDENERLFFDGLFRYGDNATKSSLYNRFYTTLNKILANANKKENIDKIYDKGGLKGRKLIIAMIILTYIAITIPPMMDYGSSGMLMALLFPGVGLIVLILTLSGSLGTKIFGIIWGLFFGGIPWCFMVLPELLQDEKYLIGYGIGVVAIIGMLILLSKEKRRTQYGNNVLGKIRGFKNFLETAEKEKLESLVEKNPNYFYDILPYTYVLNVSDKWIKKFESINLQAPEWYEGSESFNFASFSSFVDDTVKAAGSSMSSSPDSGGSGSSGGGSSGGGSGGGGGSSW